MCTIFVPRSLTPSAKAVNIRGVFEAALTPMMKIASALCQSTKSTVPFPVPSAAVSARPLASWHILEQSGRLFVPNSRAKS